MKKINEKLLTLNEISQVLRVSRHTVQAWISPSSPNHRPEFASLARHAGRKTVFVEEEVFAWLNQRKGPVYSPGISERSAYWQERFIAGRGLLKGLIKSPESSVGFFPFQGGLLALDTEPIVCWLSDGPGASGIHNLIMGADGIILSVPLVSWLIRRSMRFPGKLKEVQDFMLNQNVFELAPFNEDAVRRSLELPVGLNENSAQNYCCSIAAGCASFLTGNKNLLKIPGLPVTSF